MGDPQMDTDDAGCLRSDVSNLGRGDNPQNNQMVWKSVFQDAEVRETMRSMIHPCDLLPHFYYIDEAWRSEIRQTQEHQGRRAAVDKLLDYLVQIVDEDWPSDLSEGLEKHSQKSLAEALFKKHQEVLEKIPTSVSIDEHDSLWTGATPNTDLPDLPTVIIQHYEVFTKAVRKTENELRERVSPEAMLDHLPYVNRDSVMAALRTKGKMRAMEELVTNLLIRRDDRDWPSDLVGCLRQINQGLLAIQLETEYRHLIQKTREKKYNELHKYIDGLRIRQPVDNTAQPGPDEVIQRMRRHIEEMDIMCSQSPSVPSH